LVIEKIENMITVQKPFPKSNFVPIWFKLIRITIDGSAPPNAVPTQH